MKAIKPALGTPLTSPLGVEDDRASPHFGWLCCNYAGEWVLLADLKPIGHLLQPQLLGWTMEQWESAWNDLLVHHWVNPGAALPQIPPDVAAAREMMLRWMREIAKGKITEPACMAPPMFLKIGMDMERAGALYPASGLNS